MLIFLRRRKALSFLLGLLLIYLGFRIQSFYEQTHTDISIGSKNFTESVLLGELYAQALERKGFRVQRKFNLGGTLIAHEALKHGEIDFYPEYTGTGLIDILKIRPPAHENTALRLLVDNYEKKWRLRWLQPTRANNAQGLVMSRQLAQRYHITNLSELAKQTERFNLGSIPEFDEREDGLKGLRKFYGGFQFKKVALYDNGLKYQVLKRGDVDVTVAFTTDGALTDPALLLLKDDRHFWPSYHVAPVVHQKILTRYPALVGILNRVSARLDTETLQQLNYQVDEQKRDYKIVIKNYLMKTL